MNMKKDKCVITCDGRIIDIRRGLTLNPDSHKKLLYTGLRDKNGKKIYSGFLVKYKNFFSEKEETIKPVTFKDGIFYAGYQLKDVNSICEIVGNIYQNNRLNLN